MDGLTEDQKKFVKDVLKEDSGLVVTDKGNSLKVKNKPIDRKTPFYKKPISWAIAVMALAIMLCVIFIAFLVRAKLYLGDSINYLASRGMSALDQQVAAQNGYAWLPQFLSFYNHRWIIVAIVVTVAIIISSAIVIISDSRKKKRKKNEDSEKEASDKL